MQDVQAFCVRSHQRVLDAVVHHLHEVAGARGPAVQVADLLGRGIAGRDPACARRGLDARRERAEDRIEPCDRAVGSTDHQAEAAFESEHPAARPAVDVVDLLAQRAARARDVVAVEAVAAVDDRVARREVRCERRRRPRR